MNWRDYIISDPDILTRKPSIKGTRIGVDLILEKLSYGRTVEELLASYPSLTKEAIYACHEFTSGAN